MSLVLGLEHSCPWPRECLSLERLSLALASDFFVSLALASSLVSSTPPLLFVLPVSIKARATMSLTLTFAITCLRKDECRADNDDKLGEFTHPVGHVFTAHATFDVVTNLATKITLLVPGWTLGTAVPITTSTKITHKSPLIRYFTLTRNSSS